MVVAMCVSVPAHGDDCRAGGGVATERVEVAQRHGRQEERVEAHAHVHEIRAASTRLVQLDRVVAARARLILSKRAAMHSPIGHP